MAVVSLGAAIVKEMRKPAADREWNGELAGFIPYEFRIPTLSRITDRLWNPDLERIFTPTIFGVGWAINFGRIVRLAEMQLAR